MMKRNIAVVLMTIICFPAAFAQSAVYKLDGTCGEDTKWVFDGYTLTIQNVNKRGESVAIDDYDLNIQKAPWITKKLNVKKIEIGANIKRIGSCAFANCTELQEVLFKGTDLTEIGWGAFLNCNRLRNISLPRQLRSIETIAFADCSSLTAISIPSQCRVGNQAFASCTNIKTIELGPTTILGQHIFASEVKVGDKVRHSLYSGEIRSLPSYINKENCHEFGLSMPSVAKLLENQTAKVNYDQKTSSVDSMIPNTVRTRQDTYVLIIGNQNYRFVADVPYAIHDARVFAEYCKNTLGIPTGNIHLSEDATKQMILEEELEDWMKSISDREKKDLIVYYAGHGVPDIKNKNKAYILPTDVRGTNPHRGIALDDFYAKIGDLAFNRVSVFMDACFSGINRDNEGVSEGLRGVEIEAEEAAVGNGRMVVFSAAQGNETAQGYPEQGHGLFTYYLLKELQNSNGDIKLGDLSDRLRYNVSQQAMQMKMRKKQTPATSASGEIADSWRYMDF